MIVAKISNQELILMYDDEEEMIYGKSKLLEEMKKNSAICPECGKTFEQGFKIDPKTGEKIFNKYKYCPKCRGQVAKKNQENKTFPHSRDYRANVHLRCTFSRLPPFFYLT